MKPFCILLFLRIVSVAVLTKELPGYVFKINFTHTNVVHIIDRRLLGQTTYALDQVLDLDYRGPLDDEKGELGLALAIRDRIGGVYPMLSLYPPPAPKIEVNVSVKKTTMRDLLTAAVAGKNQKYLLWYTLSTVAIESNAYVKFYP